MQPSQTNAYGLNCARCGSPLEIPANPNIVHCDCPICGLDNVLPQHVIDARRPPPPQVVNVYQAGPPKAPTLRSRAAAQYLFELERVAHRISTIAQRDRLAAGIVSTLYLRATDKARPEWFDDIETKRAVEHASEILRSAQRAMDQDPSLRERGYALLNVYDQLLRWKDFVGNDPQARLAVLDRAVESARNDAARARSRFVVSVLMIPGVFALLVVGAIIEVITGISFQNAFAHLGTWMFLGGCVASLYYLDRKSSTKKRIPEREREAFAFRSELERYHGFLADPYGGAMLEQAKHQHPALREELKV